MSRINTSFCIHGAISIAAAAAIVLSFGCARARQTTAYTTPEEGMRDPVRAQRLMLEAVDVMDTDAALAESCLREALAADIYCGPAHCNLGVLHLNAGRLYEAAHEFEWARKLMPGHPDPRVNLALTLERAGRIDDALQAYRSALEVSPGYLPSIQGLVLMQVRTQQEDEHTLEYLREVAFRADDESWRAWARGEVLRRTHDAQAASD